MNYSQKGHNFPHKPSCKISMCHMRKALRQKPETTEAKHAKVKGLSPASLRE